VASLPAGAWTKQGSLAREVSMDAITPRLRRLRNWFLALFAIQSVLAVVITADVLASMSIVGAHGAAVGDPSDAYILSWTVGVLAALLVLALWVFHELLELKPWARTVLLVVAWISAASAAVSVLGAPAASAMAPWLERYAVGIDLARLMPLSLLGNVLSLAAWGYVIRTLLSADVRAAFRCARGESH